MSDDRYGPEEPAWLEPLSRGPLRIKDDTPTSELEHELEERLVALLDSRGLEANAEGWRELALQLIIESKAAIELQTDVDLLQGGSDGAGLDNFILRTQAKKLRGELNLKSNAAVARALAKKKGETRSTGRIKNILSNKRPDQWPRADRRRTHEWRVLDILRRLAAKLESITN